MYILIDSTLRVNFKVDSACMPYDSTNLATQDGCWMIPRVSLVSVICDNDINDSVEELIVKPIRKASFFEWPRGFGVVLPWLGSGIFNKMDITQGGLL